VSTLALQGASTGQPWSLTRDTQLRSLLESAFDSLFGHGVISGGEFSQTTGFSGEVANGSVFYTEGVSLTLSAARAYTVTTPNAAEVYVWGLLQRTAATQSDPTASDTYALAVTENTTGTAPSSLYFPLAIVRTDGNGIAEIDNAPAGKFVRALPNLGYRSITLTGNTTLSAAQYRDGILHFEGAAGEVTFPDEAGRRWIVYADTAGPLSLTNGTGDPLTLAAGDHAVIYAGSAGLVRVDGAVATLADDLEALQGEHDDTRRLFRALLREWGLFGFDVPDELQAEFALAVAEA
jgi:hypothetical protein